MIISQSQLRNRIVAALAAAIVPWLTTAPAYADAFLNVGKGLGALRLGSGYSIVNGELRNTHCVEYDPDDTGENIIGSPSISPTVDMSVRFVESTSDLATTLGVSTDASGFSPSASGSLERTTLEQSARQATDMYLVVSVIASSADSPDRALRIKPKFQKYLDEGQVRKFARACGETYVRDVRRGLKYYAVFRFTAISASQIRVLRQAFSASVKIGPSGGSASQSSESILRSALSNTTVTINQSTYGIPYSIGVTLPSGRAADGRINFEEVFNYAVAAAAKASDAKTIISAELADYDTIGTFPDADIEFDFYNDKIIELAQRYSSISSRKYLLNAVSNYREDFYIAVGSDTEWTKSINSQLAELDRQLIGLQGQRDACVKLTKRDTNDAALSDQEKTEARTLCEGVVQVGPLSPPVVPPLKVCNINEVPGANDSVVRVARLVDGTCAVERCEFLTQLTPIPFHKNAEAFSAHCRGMPTTGKVKVHFHGQWSTPENHMGAIGWWTNLTGQEPEWLHPGWPVPMDFTEEVDAPTDGDQVVALGMWSCSYAPNGQGQPCYVAPSDGESAVITVTSFSPDFIH